MKKDLLASPYTACRQLMAGNKSGRGAKLVAVFESLTQQLFLVIWVWIQQGTLAYTDHEGSVHIKLSTCLSTGTIKLYRVACVSVCSYGRAELLRLRIQFEWLLQYLIFQLFSGLDKNPEIFVGLRQSLLPLFRQKPISQLQLLYLKSGAQNSTRLTRGCYLNRACSFPFYHVYDV